MFLPQDLVTLLASYTSAVLRYGRASKETWTQLTVHFWRAVLQTHQKYHVVDPKCMVATLARFPVLVTEAPVAYACNYPRLPRGKFRVQIRTRWDIFHAGPREWDQAMFFHDDQCYYSILVNKESFQCGYVVNDGHAVISGEFMLIAVSHTYMITRNARSSIVHYRHKTTQSIHMLKMQAHAGRVAVVKDRFLCVADHNSQILSIVDMVEHATICEIYMWPAPHVLALGPDGILAMAGEVNWDFSSLELMDTSTWRITKRLMTEPIAWMGWEGRRLCLSGNRTLCV